MVWIMGGSWISSILLNWLGFAEGYQRNKDVLKDDESEKVYECRFCSLKFCKSQALGGHMNRHRQG